LAEIATGEGEDEKHGSDTATERTQRTDELSSLGDFVYYSSTIEEIRVNKSEDISPDFFELTAADVRMAQNSLSAQATAYRDAPLLTESVRSRRHQERRDKWPTTLIRIKFADRSLLEKSFPSSDRIKAIYAFVRSCLQEDIRSHKFILFDAPPRRDLRVSDPAVKDKSLYDLRLTPRSVLHFKFLEDNMDFDLPSGPPPLLSAILARAVALPSEARTEEAPAVATLGSIETDKSQAVVEKKLSRLLRLTKKK